MTRLFCFVDNTEYSEGELTFYIAADSKDDALAVYRSYVESKFYWGEKIPSANTMEKQFHKNLSYYVIKECPGIFVDDSRKHHMFHDVENDDCDWWTEQEYIW